MIETSIPVGSSDWLGHNFTRQSMKTKPNIQEARLDVPLAEAVLCYIPDSDKAMVVSEPNGPEPPNDYFTCGAVYGRYHAFTPELQLLNLLIEGMQCIVRSKVDPMAMHAALCQIPDYREKLAWDVPGSNAS